MQTKPDYWLTEPWLFERVQRAEKRERRRQRYRDFMLVLLCLSSLVLLVTMGFVWWALLTYAYQYWLGAAR